MSLETAIKSPWEFFLQILKKNSSSTEFQNWISPISLIEESSSQLVLGVPNVFVKEYFLENFKKELGEFFISTGIAEKDIAFIIQEPKVVSPSVSIKKLFSPTSGLQKNYTFETFIEGPSNQFVKSAAVGVAHRPGKTYNPLFIHGRVGLGKTHLLHGIGHYVEKHNRKLKVQSITTEAFINDLVDHLKNKSVDKMKKHYRNLDVLLVDDIQFLQSRLNFEEEFCNTFESLIHHNKQIVITSDKPPSELRLSERLTARMEWGLVAHIAPPDLETRVAIIYQKAEQRGLELSEEIAFFIAEHIHVNVRQIEGAINRLYAYYNLMKIPLTEEKVVEILSELIQKSPYHKVSIEQILQSVAKLFEVNISEMKGESRQKEIALARQVAMYLAKELLPDSLNKIASFFGGRTHSTLIHAWKKVGQKLEKDDSLKTQIAFVRKSLHP